MAHGVYTSCPLVVGLVMVSRQGKNHVST